MNITQEFGCKNNPNSQAYIESFHLSVQYEFVDSIEFDYIEDVYDYYVSCIYFYNNLRPHGSLKYLTPKIIFNLFSTSNNEAKDLEIKLEKLTVSENRSFPYFFSYF